MNVLHARGRLATARIVCVLALLVGAGACASGPKKPPVGAEDPDKFLFDHGNEALAKRRWYVAREFFSQILANYPQSSYRPSAKLGLADSYLGEGTLESQVMAINEFKEFLTFYPTHDLAHYAQFKIGMAHYYEMRASARDQTETREAIAELTNYVQRYKDKPLFGEASKRLREAKDRLSDHEYGVGFFYLRSRMSIPGAIDRFNAVLKTDPEYTRRDAVYYQMAQALVLLDQHAAALPYLERLVNEFEQSEYLDEAKKEIPALKARITTAVKK
jgi:outer membrane protein assembly factor BamD